MKSKKIKSRRLTARDFTPKRQKFLAGSLAFLRRGYCRYPQGTVVMIMGTFHQLCGGSKNDVYEYECHFLDGNSLAWIHQSELRKY